VPAPAPALLAIVEPGTGLVGRWSPAIGDPTFAGWLTTAAYLLASVLCWRAHQVSRRWSPAGGTIAVPRLWQLLAAAMLALGINKQLDLQTMFTELGRTLAIDQGWYERRRAVQAIFVAMLLIGGAVAAVAVARLARRQPPQMRLALVGVVLLICFILLRASSFHHLDRLLGRSLGGLGLNSVLELGGIGCVALSALSALRNWRRSHSG
jgi:hypothetical protein